LSTRLTPRDLAWILIVVAVWGFAFVPIKVALREVPPFAAVALRFALAAVPLAFFIRPPRIPWRYVVAYGAAIGIFQFGLLFLGMQLGMPAGLSSLVIQVQVFFTIGLGMLVLRDRTYAHNAIGALIAFAGILLLAVNKIGEGASATFTGFVLVILAAVAWAAGNIVAKKAASVHAADMFALVVWSSFIPPLPLAIAAYLFEGGDTVVPAVLHAGPLTWASILFMAWGATLFGFASWAHLLHKHPTALISPFALLIPVSGLASGALFLDEGLSRLQVAGAVLVFAGLAVNVFGLRLREWLAL
jgi:O-acetylserine/cysteine efflux transporter